MTEEFYLKVKGVQFDGTNLDEIQDFIGRTFRELYVIVPEETDYRAYRRSEPEGARYINERFNEGLPLNCIGIPVGLTSMITCGLDWWVVKIGYRINVFPNELIKEVRVNTLELK